MSTRNYLLFPGHASSKALGKTVSVGPPSSQHYKRLGTEVKLPLIWDLNHWKEAKHFSKKVSSLSVEWFKLKTPKVESFRICKVSDIRSRVSACTVLIVLMIPSSHMINPSIPSSALCKHRVKQWSRPAAAGQQHKSSVFVLSYCHF